MLRFLTAGESHGPAEIAILEGIPAGLNLSIKDIQPDLERRRQESGRGGRGKIETDEVKILSGVRHGKTLGSPIALLVENKDFKNWQEIMRIEKGLKLAQPMGVGASHLPRPGHADLAGSLKYHFSDLRNVIERASARETVMRVAIGAICKKFLSVFKIKITSQIVQIGPMKSDFPLEKPAIEKMIVEATKRKETLGGVVKLIAQNVPPGLGSYTHWDKRLDAKLAMVLMSIPSVKAVEIGEGIKISSLFGSQVHDEIYYDEKRQKFYRKTNRAGGIEGGISNGEDITCKIYFKPLPTLGNPLKTINIKTKKSAHALVERSDICAVPRAGVIGEAMAAYVLADFFLEKFGSDTIWEISYNFENYLKNLTRL